MFKNFDDVQKLGKDQFDAMAAVSANLTKGMQQITTEATDYSKKYFETANVAAEKLIGSKSIESAIEVQTDYAKSSYEAFIAQSKKMGELYTSLAKDSFKPVEKAVAKASSAAK